MAISGLIGDFDGDGLDDVLRPSAAGGSVEILGLRGGLFVRLVELSADISNFSNWLTADVNGDGRDEWLNPGASGIAVTFVEPGTSRIEYWDVADGGAFNWRTGDFDGDGRDDLMRTVSGRGVEVLLSTGTALSSAGIWSPSGSGADGWYVGDLDGDGRADIFNYLPGVAGADAWLSDGVSRFQYGGAWTRFAHADGKWTLADFNGDGLADLIDSAGEVYYSDGATFAYAGNLAGATGEMLIGDFDGDGRDDLLSGTAPGDLPAPAVDIPLSLEDRPKIDAAVEISKFAYAGRLIEISAPDLGPGFEYRVLSHEPNAIGATAWTDHNRLVVSPGGPSIAIQIQAVDQSTGHLVVDGFGANGATVYDEVVVRDLMDLGRFNIAEIASDISLAASAHEWRDGIADFNQFQDVVEQKFLESADTAAAGDAGSLDRAFFYMQWVSGLWHYGGFGGGFGCVFNNEVTGAIDPASGSIRTYLDSPIGCCTDYSALLGSLLNKAGYETRIILGQGHVFNEVKIGGVWWTFDAQTGTAFNASWDQVIDPTNEVDLFRFSHAAMTEGSPVYSAALVNASQMLLFWYANGFFPGANRFELIDWYQQLPYADTLLANVDTTGWTPTPLVPIDADTLPPGISAAQLVDLVSANRFAISNVNGSLSEAAAAAEWRDGISDLGSLVNHIVAQAAAAGAIDQAGQAGATGAAIAAFQWVSGMWSLAASDDAGLQPIGVDAFIEFRDAGDADFAALFVRVLQDMGLSATVQRSGGQLVVETVIDGSAWSFVPALGLVFEDAWANVVDGHSAVRAFWVSLPGTAIGAQADDLVAARLEFIAQAGNALSEAGVALDAAAWASGSPNGHLFASPLNGTGADPTILSIVLTEMEIAGDGGDLLHYRISFSEAVENVTVDALVLTGTPGSILSVVEIGPSSYDVSVSRDASRTGQPAPGLGFAADHQIASTTGQALMLEQTVSAGPFVGQFGPTSYVGGNGYDEVDYPASLTAFGGVHVDLRDSVGSGGDAEGDRFDSIEGIVGSSHADALFGDDGSNILEGGAGDDLIVGRDGSDVLLGGAGDDRLASGMGADRVDGGAGTDTADYMGSYAVWVDLLSGLGRWNAAHEDVLVGVENLIGSDVGDWLYGDDGANHLEGGAGNDLIVGRGGDDRLTSGMGADRLDGGAGADTADYAGHYAVWVDLLSGLGQWNAAHEDVLAGVENLIGSDRGDWLYGDDGANLIEGGAGDDLIVGRGGSDILIGGDGDDRLASGMGADRLDGGAGADTADYSGFYAVWVDLLSGVGQWNAAHDDVLGAIENVLGSDRGDWLYGDDGDNLLEGGAGDDLIVGRGGSDSLIGGDGDDRLTSGMGADRLDGGAGTDTADYSGFYAVWVDLMSGLGRWNAAHEDVLSGVENLIGSDRGDWLYGDDGDNRLEGGAGDDLIVGRGGSDVLIGGAGSDIFGFETLSGTTTIADWQPGDKIRFATALFADFEAVLDRIEQIDGSVRITTELGAVLLPGTQLADLGEAGFLFG